MKSTNAATFSGQRKGEDLDGRYGKIGISAVAAALRYQSEAKNQEYAPVVPSYDRERAEMAAA